MIFEQNYDFLVILYNRNILYNRPGASRGLHDLLLEVCYTKNVIKI